MKSAQINNRPGHSDSEPIDRMTPDSSMKLDDTADAPLSTVSPRVTQRNSVKSLIRTPTSENRALVKNDFFRSSYESLDDILNNVHDMITKIKPVNFEPPSYLDESFVRSPEPYEPDITQNNVVSNKSFFVNVRDSLVEYQSSQNISSDPYSFISLITTLCTLGCKAIHTIFIMIMALFPMIEILIHVSRFLIDHLLDILNTSNRQEMIQKSFIFVIEIGLISCLVIFIFGSVLLPLWSLGVLIVYKIMCFFTV